MPWLSLDLAPGLNSERTPLAIGAGYANTTLLRFKGGLAQKMGGWTKSIPTPITGEPFDMHTWEDFNSTYFMGFGTNTSLTVLSGTMPITGNSAGQLSLSSYKDITPQVFTSNSTTVNCTTTAGSSVVSIVDTGITGITSYCSVYINTPISVDGIILSGMYPINIQTGTTSYTIVANSQYSTQAVGLAGVTNGGAVAQLTTASGSSLITVTLPNHGQSVGSIFVLSLPITIASLTLQGPYSVQSVTNANDFIITVPNQANSTVSNTYINSGNASFTYFIASGPTLSGSPYGSGTYSTGLYGYGQTLTGMTGTPIVSNNWTLSNFNQNFIACQENGNIFYWPPDQGVQNAIVIPNSPPFNAGAFTSSSQGMIIAYGSSTYPLGSIGVYQDPLLVRWTDSLDFTDWGFAPSSSSQAGTFNISSGSRLVGGMALPQFDLLWTDVDCHMMTYSGYPYTFSITKQGSNCGLIGKHAVAQLSGSVYWLSRNNIFSLAGGGVNPIPCPVWDLLFQDLNLSYANLCWVGTNSLFYEVIYAFSSIIDNLPYPTRYVKHNVLENTWDYGILQRNCWLDQSIFGPPMAITVDGKLYTHEIGQNADNAPMTSGFKTGLFYIDDGRQVLYVDQIIPDLKYSTVSSSTPASMNITVYAYDYPEDNPVIYGPYNFTKGQKFIQTNIRGRHLAFQLESSDSGSWWRWEKFRVRYTSSGIIM